MNNSILLNYSLDQVNRKPVRVGMYGNMCNCLYQLGKAVRNRTDIDVHLFLDCRHKTQMLPESDDKELKGNYPPWIHVGDYLPRKALLAPFLSPLVAELNKFDFVILCENGPIFAPFLKGKKTFFMGGGDLTVFPFFWRRYLFRRISIKEKIGAFTRGFWQARGIRSMDQIWSQPFAPCIIAQKRLRVQDRVASTYFPIPVDTDLFSPDVSFDESHPIATHIVEAKRRFDFVLFHPSRFMVDDSPSMKETGQWKNNCLLLEGFRRFVDTKAVKRPGLLLIEKAGHTKDLAIVKKKIEDLRLESYIQWLKPEQGQFPREQLAALYSMSDCVADEFGVGWFGSIVLEGLACGKPVINHIDESAMSQIYPNHPIISVTSAEGISESLVRIATNREYLHQVQNDSRHWVVKYHSLESVSKKYAQNILESVENRLDARKQA